MLSLRMYFLNFSDKYPLEYVLQMHRYIQRLNKTYIFVNPAAPWEESLHIAFFLQGSETRMP